MAEAIRLYLRTTIDDETVTDFCLDAYGIGGFDWEISFYRHKDIDRWTGLFPIRTLPGKSIAQGRRCLLTDMPPELLTAAQLRRAAVIADHTRACPQ